MKCYYSCGNEASAKIGTSKGNILAALFSPILEKIGFKAKKCWSKREVYVCREHYDEMIKEGNKDD